METEIFGALTSVIMFLLGGICYFAKRIFDKTDSIEKDIGDMKPKLNILWERAFAAGASPLALNEVGRRILEESGVKELVDSEIDRLMQNLIDQHPENAYQIQECSGKALKVLKDNPVILSRLQEGAFKTGVDVDAVLFAGALYFRDLVLPKYQFKSGDPVFI